MLAAKTIIETTLFKYLNLNVLYRIIQLTKGFNRRAKKIIRKRGKKKLSNEEL